MAVMPVYAQSSVVIFGTVDVGVGVASTNGRTKAVSRASGINPSRLGLRGSEDLGDGYSTAFWIEGGLDPDVGTQGGSNGTANAFWNRRSTLSLATPAGEIRLGRDYTGVFSNMADFDPANTNGSGSSTILWSYLGSNAVTNVRANNTVSYTTPNLEGLSGQLMVSPSEGLDGQRYRGARLTYYRERLRLAAATSETIAGPLPGGIYRTTNLAASYKFDGVLIEGFTNKYAYGPRRAIDLLVGVVVPIGRVEFHGSYQVLNAYGAGTGANDARQLFVNLTYVASKNTALYLNFSRLRNEGAASYAMPNAPLSPQGAFTNRGAEAGIRHFF
ncbi:porin [Roseateles noduli]|uniref:porin n=1 Tax=Roseateles noduli TaxID=2052484 RepID=UPI003D64B9DF